MPSPFQGIDIATRALRAFQRQQEVAGNNVANVNTPGYSRQSADLSATRGLDVYGVQHYTLGTGVSVTTVNRIRDLFLEGRMQTAQSDLSRLGTMADNLARVEPMLSDSAGGGVSTALNRFFSAWSGLASGANDPAARLEVQQSGASLAMQIRSTYQQLSSQEAQISNDLSSNVSQINELTQHIAALNNEIRSKLGAGITPNELLDARDLAVGQLSNLVDVRTVDQPDGSMNVYIDQYTAVEGKVSRPIPATIDPGTSSFTVDGKTYTVRGGTLAGLAQSQNNLAAYRGSLDTLANTLRTEVNALHQTGINKLGNTGVNFFNDATPPDPQTGAVDFNLSAEVAGSLDAIAAGTSGAAGDGGVALALSRVRDQSIPALGNRSPTQFYGDLVSSVGRDVAFYRDSADTQTSVVDQIEQQRQSVSGVSLDDEMADMLRFQRSYQAAAKLLSVFDQMTNDLINMLNR
ncbi:MAG: flagellar hook-associated protein FlgK [Fimbriimonadaceae bacterium]|nr:flagellar hook-associated protein FlgK [Fimbriimonadaceae bacterium]